MLSSYLTTANGCKTYVCSYSNSGCVLWVIGHVSPADFNQHYHGLVFTDTCIVTPDFGFVTWLVRNETIHNDFSYAIMVVPHFLSKCDLLFECPVPLEDLLKPKCEVDCNE